MSAQNLAATDDDREAIAQIVKDVAIKWGGPSMAEFANTPPIRKHYATADAIFAAGFRRSEVPERTTDLCEWCDMTARGNALHPGHDMPRRSCGEKYHGEEFEPDAETRGEESAEVQSLRAELAAMTEEKEKWRIRCAEETIAWADEATENRRLLREPQGEPSDADLSKLANDAHHSMVAEAESDGGWYGFSHSRDAWQNGFETGYRARADGGTR